MKKTSVIEFVQSVGDGGAETLVKDYAILMDKEQFDVTVVVQHDVRDSANWQRLQEKGIRVVALSSQDDILKKIWRSIFWRKEAQSVSSEEVKERAVLPGETYEETGFLRRCRNAVRNFYFGLRFLRVVKQTGATVIHGHLDVLSCMRSVSAGLKHVRLFHTCHALPELIYAGEEGDAARYLIRCNGLQLIALHPDMAKQMDELFPEQKTKVFRNGIDMKAFQLPDSVRASKRAELGIPEDAFVVGHVGRFTPEKNHAFLVEVYEKIRKKEKNAWLLMVGAEDHSHIVRQLDSLECADQYRILSHRKDVNELLKAMDVFVFPSLFEGFGIALLEAQAAGLRCVASDRCPAEVLRLETCIPLPPEDPECWAEAALDTGRRQERQLPLEDYDMNRELRRLERLYLGEDASGSL